MLHSSGENFKTKLDVNIQNAKGRTPLHDAILEDPHKAAMRSDLVGFRNVSWVDGCKCNIPARVALFFSADPSNWQKPLDLTLEDADYKTAETIGARIWQDLLLKWNKSQVINHEKNTFKIKNTALTNEFMNF